MLCSAGSSTKVRGGRRSLAVMLLVAAAWAALALAACGGSEEAARPRGRATEARP